MYLDHYDAYLAKLKAIKSSAIVEKVEKRAFTVKEVVNECGLARRYLLNKAWTEYNGTNHSTVISTIGFYKDGVLKHFSPENVARFIGLALEGEEIYNAGDIFSLYSRLGTESKCRNASTLKVPALKEELIIGDIVKKTVTVEKVPKATKPKGPAQTPKKVRTPAEQIVFDAKAKARAEKNAWFREHKTLIGKGKVLKTLSKQAAGITSAVRIAAPGLTANVVPDEGWKLVTHTRKGRETFRETVKADGKTTSRRFSRSLER